MMEVWLIFNLLLPLMEVLLHNYMDYLRNDDDREMNHHGTAIKPNNDKESNDDDDGPNPNTTKVFPITLALISRNEGTQRSCLVIGTKVNFASRSL